MARPKGSKNKPRDLGSYEGQMKDVQSQMKAQDDLVANLEAEVEALSAKLASKKSALRSARSVYSRLARQLTGLEEKVGEARRREDATKLLEGLLASGKSIDELEEAIGRL